MDENKKVCVQAVYKSWT